MQESKSDANSETAAAQPYAVVRTGGKQYRVSPGDTLLIEKVAGEAGEQLELSEVLLASDGDAAQIKIGTPLVKGASVKAKIVAQEKSRKIIVFKKRRRKGYTNKQGHRQNLTRIAIESIDA